MILPEPDQPPGVHLSLRAENNLGHLRQQTRKLQAPIHALSYPHVAESDLLWRMNRVNVYVNFQWLRVHHKVLPRGASLLFHMFVS